MRLILAISCSKAFIENLSPFDLSREMMSLGRASGAIFAIFLIDRRACDFNELKSPATSATKFSEFL